MKVYIWYPSWRAKQVGHAALTLDDGTHISWWPSEKLEGKKSKKMDEDIKLEGKPPNKTFTVTGLDEKTIKDWWENFREAGDKYHLAEMNCCHIVMNALKAGGFKCKEYAEYLLDPGSVESLVESGVGVAVIT